MDDLTPPEKLDRAPTSSPTPVHIGAASALWLKAARKFVLEQPPEHVSEFDSPTSPGSSQTVRVRLLWGLGGQGRRCADRLGTLVLLSVSVNSSDKEGGSGKRVSLNGDS